MVTCSTFIAIFPQMTLKRALLILCARIGYNPP
jgi:hypothetical protein